MTIRELSELFMELYAGVNNRPSEFEQKEMALKNHLLPEFGQLEADTLRVKHIEQFKARQLLKKLSPKTINNQLTVLRRLLNWAHEMEYIGHVPVIKPLRCYRRSRHAHLTPQEAAQLLQVLGDPWREMAYVALYSGLRLGELIALRWEDFCPANSTLHVQRADWRGLEGPPKSGQARLLPLHTNLGRWVKATGRRRGKVWPTARYMPAQCAMRTASERLGFRVRWHMLRHTFASWLAQSGAPMRHLQELMGHSTVRMTEAYAHLAPRTTDTAVEMLPNF